MRSERRRLLLAVAAAVAVVAPLAWMWQDSRLPSTYSVMDMGHVDLGGGALPVRLAGGHAHHGGDGPNVADLVADPDRPADVRVTLIARQERFALATGEEVDGYTLNGTSPGPVLRAVEDQLVEVRLENASVRDGTTLHWHGVDVPNAEDGVAGVTQDAVPVGGVHTYRFVADQAGTFWYHAHQLSHRQVQGGLLGALVVAPREPDPEVRDELALVHVYGGRQTLNGRTDDTRVDVPDGTRIRVRVINTDNGTATVWGSGAPYRVVAVDGTDVVGPTPVEDRRVALAAGGRVDLEVTAPARVELGAAGAVLVGKVDDLERSRVPARSSTCSPTARPRRSASTPTTPTAASTTTSGGGPGSSTADPASGGR